MANLEAFLQQSAAYVKQTLPGLPAYSKIARKQIEHQVTECLERYRGLALRVENYAPDGSAGAPRNMALLTLEGTVPMTYRNKAYNIPVSIRLPQGFPVAAPQCYVLQKNGLRLKPQHTVVTPTGLCNFSRFEKAQWDPKRSSMRDQVDQMVLVFGMEPPLFSPSSASTSAAQQALGGPQGLPSSGSSLSFHTLVTVATAAASDKGAGARAWDPKEPTKEELALPLDSLVRLLAKLETEDADSEDASDEAFQSLREEKIKAEEYLKTVRRLAWEQFIKRALAMKAAHLRPFLEQRETQEAEWRSAERAEQERREREAERVRAEEQQRVRAEEERRWAEDQARRAEDERRRAEEEQRRAEEERRRAEEARQQREDEHRRVEQERYEQQVIEEQRLIAEQAAARAAQEARDRAEQERLWREEQARQVAEQEARKRKQEEDRRLAEELEREERARLQQMELQQMQAANAVGGQGGQWPAPRPGYFQPSQAPHFQPAEAASFIPGYGQGPGPPAEPVPAFPYQPPAEHMPPPQQFLPSLQFRPQLYPGPYAPAPMPNQVLMMPLPPPGQYMQPPPPYMQPQAGGAYMMQGMWPPAPPTGYH